jgi:hypothetical protein
VEFGGFLLAEREVHTEEAIKRYWQALTGQVLSFASFTPPTSALAQSRTPTKGKRIKCCCFDDRRY